MVREAGGDQVERLVPAGARPSIIGMEQPAVEAERSRRARRPWSRAGRSWPDARGRRRSSRRRRPGGEDAAADAAVGAGGADRAARLRPAERGQGRAGCGRLDAHPVRDLAVVGPCASPVAIELTSDVQRAGEPWLPWTMPSERGPPLCGQRSSRAKTAVGACGRPRCSRGGSSPRARRGGMSEGADRPVHERASSATPARSSGSAATQRRFRPSSRRHSAARRVRSASGVNSCAGPRSGALGPRVRLVDRLAMRKRATSAARLSDRRRPAPSPSRGRPSRSRGSAVEVLGVLAVELDERDGTRRLVFGPAVQITSVASGRARPRRRRGCCSRRRCRRCPRPCRWPPRSSAGSPRRRA